MVGLGIVATVMGLAAGGETPVTESNVAFFYEARAVVPAPMERLAMVVSMEFVKAADEFVRYDLLQRMMPALETKLAEAASETEVVMTMGTEIGEYDFERGAFPTSMSAASGVAYHTHIGIYLFEFENLGQSPIVPMEASSARDIARALRMDRSGTLRIRATLREGVREQDMTKVLTADITSMELFLEGGRPVGMAEFGSGHPSEP